MNVNIQELAAWIRHEQLVQGVSNTTLALICDSHPMTITRWQQNNYRNTQLRYILKILEHLGYPDISLSIKTPATVTRR